MNLRIVSIAIKERFEGCTAGRLATLLKAKLNREFVPSSAQDRSDVEEIVYRAVAEFYRGCKKFSKETCPYEAWFDKQDLAVLHIKITPPCCAGTRVTVLVAREDESWRWN